MSLVEVCDVDMHAETNHHRGQKGEEGKSEGCKRANVQGMTKVVATYSAEKCP